MYILEAELEEKNKEAGNVGDENDDDDDENHVDSKKSKVVAQLKAEIFAAHAAFGDTVDTATRTRSTNTVKKSTKSLSVKIKALANMLKKKTAEHQELVEEIALERKEHEDMLKQTAMSIESNLEDALRREKARAAEELTLKTSELDDHIVTLSRQLKVAEAEVAELQKAGTSSFLSPIHAPTSYPTRTPSVTPTPFRTPPSSAVPTKPLFSIPFSRACEDVCEHRNTGASATQIATFEYIDALDATASIIHLRHLQTLDYITSLIDPDLSIDPDLTGVAELLAKPYICRWPNEWTKRVDALKKVRGEGWEVEVRMMNCIKMYGVSWTTLGVMVVRDHTSKGVPTMFWEHNLRKKENEEVEWKVANRCDDDVFGRVLKTPISMGYHDTSGVHSYTHTPSVQGDMTPDGASYTKVKAFLQECMDVVGVDNESQLLSALKKCRDDQDKIRKVVILSEKVTECKEALQDAVDAANPILGGVMMAAAVASSGRTGGSNPGKKKRWREKCRREKQSESTSIHQPSSHNGPPKKQRLEHD